MLLLRKLVFETRRWDKRGSVCVVHLRVQGAGIHVGAIFYKKTRWIPRKVYRLPILWSLESDWTVFVSVESRFEFSMVCPYWAFLRCRCR